MRVSGVGFSAQGLEVEGFIVSGVAFRFWGFGLGTWGFGFRIGIQEFVVVCLGLKCIGAGFKFGV